MAWLLAELADEYFSQAFSDVIHSASANHFDTEQLARLRKSNSRDWKRFRDEEDALLADSRCRRLLESGWSAGDKLEAELKRLKALDYKNRGGLAGSKDKEYIEYRKLFVREFIVGIKNGLTFSNVRDAALSAVALQYQNNKIDIKTANRWLEMLENISSTTLVRQKRGRPSKKK